MPISHVFPDGREISTLRFEWNQFDHTAVRTSRDEAAFRAMSRAIHSDPGLAFQEARTTGARHIHPAGVKQHDISCADCHPLRPHVALNFAAVERGDLTENRCVPQPCEVEQPATGDEGWQFENGEPGLPRDSDEIRGVTASDVHLIDTDVAQAIDL